MPAPSRPHISRPFSDGSMAIETDILASLDRPQSAVSQASPFSFSQSLPGHAAVDQMMTSPHSNSLNINDQNNNFHSMFSHFKLGNDNPEPPIQFPGSEIGHGPRSHSDTRQSHVGKAPVNKSRSGRMNSFSETRPVSQPRGRPQQLHPRTMSQSDSYPNRMSLGIVLDTHKEDAKSNSLGAPDFNYSGTFGTSATRHSIDSSSWTSIGRAPSLVPGSFGSYHGNQDDVITDSPVTPASQLPRPIPEDDTYKKQRRRECHNQVEKRRREHINAKIEELGQLLPAHYSMVEEAVEDEEDEELLTAAAKKKKKRASSSARAQKDAAHCKGRILAQSVVYINDLKRVTDLQASRIRQLEAMLSSQQPGDGQPHPFLWSQQQHHPDHFGSQDHAAAMQLGSLAEHHLEVMPSSPRNDKDPSLMGFDLSPENPSPPQDQNRRSSSLLTPESIDIDQKATVIQDGVQETESPQLVEYQPEAKPQMQAGGVDIEAMFGMRREEVAGWRW